MEMLQLPNANFHLMRRNCEVIYDCDDVEPLQNDQEDFPEPAPMKRAFLDFANLPALDLDQYQQNDLDESDPEILLTDSDDEDDFVVRNMRDDEDADTAIDSADQDCLSDGSMSDLEDFDEVPIKNDARILFQAAE